MESAPYFATITSSIAVLGPPGNLSDRDFDTAGCNASDRVVVVGHGSLTGRIFLTFGLCTTGAASRDIGGTSHALTCP